MNETSQCIAAGPLVISSVFLFLRLNDVKPRAEKRSLFFFLISSYNGLFTDKNLPQTIDSNDINIYLPSFTIRNRCSRAISFFRILYKN